MFCYHPDYQHLTKPDLGQDIGLIYQSVADNSEDIENLFYMQHLSKSTAIALLCM